MPKSVGRPKSPGVPYPIAPYLTAEQLAWLNAQPNKSKAITTLIDQEIQNAKEKENENYKSD